MKVRDALDAVAELATSLSSRDRRRGLPVAASCAHPQAPHRLGLGV